MRRDKRAALRTAPSSRQRVTNDHGARDAGINATITPGHRDHPGVRPARAIHIERPRTGIAVMPKKPTRNQSHFRVGDAMVHPDRLVIAIHGEEHAVEPLVMKVLVALADAKAEDQVLSAVELYIRVWIGTSLPEGHGIEGSQAENPVHKAITQLRKVFGDDPKTPRYIETIRKRGYRLVADVVHLERYQRSTLPRKIWEAGSPYVGLNAFDSRHAEVFLGRSRATGDLLMAMRHQMEQQRRLVLVVGASGCGKTSLLNAGLIPIITKKGGYEGLQSLGVARCDLAGTHREDALERLSSALMEWTLEARPVFQSQSARMLAEKLRTHPETIPATLEEAFRHHADHDIGRLTHAHLLLIIDHAEALVADASFGYDTLGDVDRFLHHLCESRYACVIMVVRGDFYLALAEALPGMTERKSGEGHIDVLAPRKGEIGEIIRLPAAYAGLEFEKDPDSDERLDDTLLQATLDQPDVLPLLQHTLQMLYERRSEGDHLCFDAYREIGGLEGALAHHAERVFADLPAETQAGLDALLSRIVVMQPENDRVSAMRISRKTLDRPVIQLAEAFVRARLFVAENENSNAHYRVTHEALLRRWPRAVDWITENRRILIARTHLQKSADRWDKEGRRDDQLLNPGRPLDEAMDVRAHYPCALSNAEREFITESQRQFQRRKRTKKLAAILLASLTITSMGLAFFAISMQRIAEHQESKSTNLTSFIIGEFSEELDPTANLALIESISTNTLRFCGSMAPREATAENLVNCSRASRKLGEVMMDRGFSETSFTLFLQSKIFAENAWRITPSPATLLESAHSAAWVGRHHWLQGEPALAMLAWISYDDSANRLRDHSPIDHRYLMEASFSASNLAILDRDLGLTNESYRTISHSIALKTSATRTTRRNDEWSYELIVSRSILAGLLESNGNLHDADSLYDLLIEELDRLHRKYPAARDWERQLTSLLQFDARLSLDRGNVAGARDRIEDAIARLIRLGQVEPDHTAWRRLLAQAHLFASDVEHADGNHAKSAKHLADASTALMHPMLNSTSASRTRASILIRSALRDGSQVDIARIDHAVTTLGEIVARDGSDRHARQALAEALVLRAEHDLDQGNHSSSEHHASRAIDVLDAFGENPRDVRIVALALRAKILTKSLSTIDPLFASLSLAGYRHPEMAVARMRLTNQTHASRASH